MIPSTILLLVITFCGQTLDTYPEYRQCIKKSTDCLAGTKITEDSFKKCLTKGLTK